MTDAADIIDEATEARVSRRLELLEQATGRQVVVVSVSSLRGRDAAAFTTDLANVWAVGRADKDDGVVILVAPEERQARIAVGYGLEHVLTDRLCKKIMDEQMLPHFSKGDLPKGIEAGVGALIEQLTGGGERLFEPPSARS